MQRERKLRADVADPAALTSDARERLARELFRTHRQIFSGLTQQGFTDFVLRDHAAATRIEVYRDPSGDIVGYCAAHRYPRTVAGRAATIFGAEAGLLLPYRGHASTWLFGLLSALRYKLRHPLRRVYYLGMLVHPSSYCLLAERFPVIYPSRRRPTPPEVADAMIALAESFELPPARDDPRVRNVGWITRETPEAHRAWAESCHPDVRFYLSLNPEYTKGFGLVTLVPLGFANLAGGLLRHLRLKLTGSHGHARTGREAGLTERVR
jgi:hypothetical protein